MTESDYCSRSSSLHRSSFVPDAPMSYTQRLKELFIECDVEDSCEEYEMYSTNNLPEFDVDQYSFDTVSAMGYDVPISFSDEIMPDYFLENLSYVDGNDEIVQISGDGRHCIERVLDESHPLFSYEAVISHSNVGAVKTVSGVSKAASKLATNFLPGLYYKSAHGAYEMLDFSSDGEFGYTTLDRVSDSSRTYKLIVNGLGYSISERPLMCTHVLSMSVGSVLTTSGSCAVTPWSDCDFLRSGDFVLVDFDRHVVRPVPSSMFSRKWCNLVDIVPVTSSQLRAIISALDVRRPFKKKAVFASYRTCDLSISERWSVWGLSQAISRENRILKLFEKTNILLMLVLRLLGFVVCGNKLYNTRVSISNTISISSVYNMLRLRCTLDPGGSLRSLGDPANIL